MEKFKFFQKVLSIHGLNPQQLSASTFTPHRGKAATPRWKAVAGKSASIAESFAMSSIPKGSPLTTLPRIITISRLRNFPALLRGETRYVGWVFDPQRDGQPPRKKPIDPVTGFPAKSNDPNTWSDFPTAIKALRRWAWLCGIGYQLGGRFCVIGIDLDHCRNPLTGEIAAWAMDIIQILNSYTEISVSGTGIHIYIFGTLPKGSRNKNNKGVEIYDGHQYFVISGNRLEQYPPTVEARTDELRQVYEKYFLAEPPPPMTSTGGGAGSPSPEGTDLWVLDRCSRASNSGRFHALWSGGGDDSSSGDLGLLDILSFYTQDPAQLDRLFRSSGRMRPKWDESRRIRGEMTTYGAMSIRTALAGLRSTYDANWRSK
jgi:primase-polymerase (primpol)-like protein